MDRTTISQLFVLLAKDMVLLSHISNTLAKDLYSISLFYESKKLDWSLPALDIVFLSNSETIKNEDSGKNAKD